MYILYGVDWVMHIHRLLRFIWCDIAIQTLVLKDRTSRGPHEMVGPWIDVIVHEHNPEHEIYIDRYIGPL